MIGNEYFAAGEGQRPTGRARAAYTAARRGRAGVGRDGVANICCIGYRDKWPQFVIILFSPRLLHKLCKSFLLYRHLKRGLALVLS